MEFAFHVCNTMAETGIAMALRRLLGEQAAPPVVLCIGSDLAIGDSLGPIAGTMLSRSTGGREGYLYGTLRSPVTAKEVKYLKEFLRKTHPASKIIAVDAAVGEGSELGLIKLTDSPLRPGSGANKRLGSVGDISVLGIIGEKTTFSYTALGLTRLHLVYSMAERISSALAGYLKERSERSSQFAV